MPGGKDTCQGAFLHLTNRKKKFFILAFVLLIDWSTLKGDSGGPLYVKDYVPDASGELRLKFVQVGIVSYGDGCAKKNIAG